MEFCLSGIKFSENLQFNSGYFEKQKLIYII